ncbi:hypothetical protein AB0J82_22820 [Asanoa sp. NPDC049518]|uniref:hypothetical protein n=1 Tax=unclassified Asanoa TaxID=2685164 RepID=UPI0034155788
MLSTSERQSWGTRLAGTAALVAIVVGAAVLPLSGWGVAVLVDRRRRGTRRDGPG